MRGSLISGITGNGKRFIPLKDSQMLMQIPQPKFVPSIVMLPSAIVSCGLHLSPSVACLAMIVQRSFPRWILTGLDVDVGIAWAGNGIMELCGFELAGTEDGGGSRGGVVDEEG